MGAGGFRAILVAIVLFVAGCATPGPILTENVGALRSGIAAANQQSNLAFGAANKLAREQSINAKLTNPSQKLLAKDFPLPAPEAAIDQWGAAFGILDSYAAALQSLVDPKRSAGTGDALQALGTTLNGSSLEAGIPPSLVGAFSAFGAAIVQGASEKKATAVMRKTNFAFNQVVNDMATAIGTSGTDDGSLQNSVYTAWDDVLSNIQDDYSKLTVDDAPQRRAVIQRYLDALAARDAQLSTLSQLRQSVLALGEAHSAAARGEPGDALFWIQRVNGWLDDAEARTKAVVAKEEEPK